MKLVSIVVPMHNEEAMVDAFFEAVFNCVKNLKYKFEFIAINDGSTDKTLELLEKNQKKHKEIIIVNLSRNFGQEGAIAAGLKVASGEAIIPMDADLQDSPELIKELLEKFEEGYDVVNAKMVSRKRDSVYKRTTAKAFYKIMHNNSGEYEIPRNVNNFRLISKRVKDEIVSLKEVNRVFRFEVPFVGFKTATVEFERKQRKYGKSHFSNKMMLSLAKESIFTSSDAPTRLSWTLTIIDFILFGVSLIPNIVLAILCYTNVLPVPELVILFWWIANAILLVGGFVLVGISINNEYKSHIFKEAQGRPAYIIESVKKGGE